MYFKEFTNVIEGKSMVIWGGTSVFPGTQAEVEGNKNWFGQSLVFNQYRFQTKFEDAKSNANWKQFNPHRRAIKFLVGTNLSAEAKILSTKRV